MSDFDDFLAALRRRLAAYLAGGSERLADVSWTVEIPQQDILAFRDGELSDDLVLIERMAEFMWPNA
jgi:hypothetical protein